jgi:hypothetical protein
MSEFEDSREQDRFLPIANISRIMKKALPPNAKISKDAKECVQECVSEFISFITSEYPFTSISIKLNLPQLVKNVWEKDEKLLMVMICYMH